LDLDALSRTAQHPGTDPEDDGEPDERDPALRVSVGEVVDGEADGDDSNDDARDHGWLAIHGLNNRTRGVAIHNRSQNQAGDYDTSNQRWRTAMNVPICARDNTGTMGVVSNELTVREAFVAMSDFIWRYAQTAGDDLITLLGDTELSTMGSPPIPLRGRTG
jgi:hypothetical protein